MVAWLVVVQRVNFGIRPALYPRLPVVALLAVFLPGGERHDENNREPPADCQAGFLGPLQRAHARAKLLRATGGYGDLGDPLGGC